MCELFNLRWRCLAWWLVALVIVPVLAAAGQTAVPVGSGSYADQPPVDPKGKIAEFQNRQLFIVKEDGRSIPTNKWWTDLIAHRFARSLWSLPLRVDTSEKGVAVFFPIKWAKEGNDPICEHPITVTASDFSPLDARAKDWSDWLVSFRLGESADKYIDITLGEGMPLAWFEYHGSMDAVVNVARDDKPAFFNQRGEATSLPFTGDCIGMTVAGRQYGLFAPDGTSFNSGDASLTAHFAGQSRYLVVAALPTEKDLALFHQYAYAVPRSTQYDWHYDADRGTVTTDWKINADALKGENHAVIQGWIPHHYRKTTSDLKFVPLEYLSPRGPLKCTVGNQFAITYAFNGIVPNLPAPKPVGAANDYDPARMAAYLEMLAEQPHYGADTYWGGKDILRAGQDALMAKQTGDPHYKEFVSNLHGAMTDWFTYTPGKADHYFAYYPRWKGLVGVKWSYGSEEFNDHHFHYGYYAWASALLGAHDPAFLKDYGPMAALVARDYANWDHNDSRFPFLRTFDIWAGHSWAGGTSSPGGENQESSSEAVQSWAGLILLGQAMGDKQMLAAGVMGYAVETAATMEYWFNEGGNVFPPEWKHPITGMVWSGGKVFGTYFTGDPAWVYGINWLPASPALSYLVRDPAAAGKRFEEMMQACQAKGKPGTIKSFGSGLGSVMIGYVQMYDPAWACQQMDELWNTPQDNIAHNAGEFAIQYYLAHSNRMLGHIDWSLHTNSPTSMIFVNDATQTKSFVVWNPLSTPNRVTVYDGTKAIGAMLANPQSLTCVHTLDPK